MEDLMRGGWEKIFHKSCDFAQGYVLDGINWIFRLPDVTKYLGK